MPFGLLSLSEQVLAFFYKISKTRILNISFFAVYILKDNNVLIASRTFFSFGNIEFSRTQGRNPLIVKITNQYLRFSFFARKVISKNKGSYIWEAFINDRIFKNYFISFFTLRTKASVTFAKLAIFVIVNSPAKSKFFTNS